MVHWWGVLVHPDPLYHLLWAGQPSPALFINGQFFCQKENFQNSKIKKQSSLKFGIFNHLAPKKKKRKITRFLHLKVELGPPWSWAVGHWPSPHKNDEANLSIGDLGGPFHHCRDLCDLAKLMYFSHPSLIIYFSFLGHSEPAPTSAP
jgi:hypothetical protein